MGLYNKNCKDGILIGRILAIALILFIYFNF